MKVRNRLLNFGDNIIYQDDEWFAFSLDSVLLSNFVSVKLTDKKILDMACGNAPIPMLLTFRTNASIYGIDIQKEVIELGIQSIHENKMDKQISLHVLDINNVEDKFSAEFFDVITCNPPYFKYSNNDNINLNMNKRISRHEVLVNLDTIVQKASYLLKNGGTFAMVHRPDRLIEIIDVMEKYNIAPKKLQLCYSKVNSNCNLILIEGNKNGKSGLKILSPVIVHNADGSYSEEIRKMFGDDNDVAK